MKHDTGLRCGRRELWTDDEIPPGHYRVAAELNTGMQLIERTYVNPRDFWVEMEACAPVSERGQVLQLLP